MKKNSWIQAVACLAVVATCGSFVFAKVIRDSATVALPGINNTGTPDNALGTQDAKGKLTYNTRSNRYHLTARGTVTNDSGARFSADNVGGFGLGPVVLGQNADIKQDKFTVTKGKKNKNNDARARYNGVAIEDGLEAQL